MLIAKINNPVPVDYHEAFPSTSFPASGPSDEFLAEQGYAKVNAFREHDSNTQKLVTAEPYYESPWVYTVQVVGKAQADIDAETEAKAAQVRSERNANLAASDWTQVLDAPVDQAAWAAYRQALRDISVQSGFPWNIDWPVAP